jgi:hypothetical protein
MHIDIQPDFPRGRTPLSLIVDDPCPFINPLYYFHLQVDRIPNPPHEKNIPLEFFQSFARWARERGIRGDFSVLPYPAGLGRIDRGLDGCDERELRGWIETAQEEITPGFDIHPELLTHTLALDLDTLRMRDVSEHHWIDVQDEPTLTRYFTTAMEILQSAGLPNNGLTQPCTFVGDEAMYARAILAAEKAVNGRKQTHNFLHLDASGSSVWPRVTLWNPEAGEAVVSVWSMADDIFWITQDEENVDTDARLDRHLTPDGMNGRIADLLRGGGPIVFHTHWQSLYSNGRRSGFRMMRDFVERLERRVLAGAERSSTSPGRPAQWRKLSELSAFIAAKTGFEYSAVETPAEVRATLSSPFPCREFTVRASLPWPYSRSEDLTVTLDERRLPYDGELREGSWKTDGAEVSVCFSMEGKHSLVVSRG